MQACQILGALEDVHTWERVYIIGTHAAGQPPTSDGGLLARAYLSSAQLGAMEEHIYREAASTEQPGGARSSTQLRAAPSLEQLGAARSSWGGMRRQSCSELCRARSSSQVLERKLRPMCAVLLQAPSSSGAAMAGASAGAAPTYTLNSEQLCTLEKFVQPSALTCAMTSAGTAHSQAPRPLIAFKQLTLHGSRFWGRVSGVPCQSVRCQIQSG